MNLRIVGAAVFIFAIGSIVYAQSVDGAWTGQMTAGRGGPQDVTLTLKASGSSLTGTIKVGQGEATPIQDGKVDGGAVSFKGTQTFGENTVTINYSGKVAGDELTLTRSVEGRGGGGGRGGGRGGPQEFTLKRQK